MGRLFRTLNQADQEDRASDTASVDCSKWGAAQEIKMSDHSHNQDMHEHHHRMEDMGDQQPPVEHPAHSDSADETDQMETASHEGHIVARAACRS